MKANIDHILTMAVWLFFLATISPLSVSEAVAEENGPVTSLDKNIEIFRCQEKDHGYLWCAWTERHRGIPVYRSRERCILGDDSVVRCPGANMKLFCQVGDIYRCSDVRMLDYRERK